MSVQIPQGVFANLRWLYENLLSECANIVDALQETISIATDTLEAAKKSPLHQAKIRRKVLVSRSCSKMPPLIESL